MKPAVVREGVDVYHAAGLREVVLSGIVGSLAGLFLLAIALRRTEAAVILAPLSAVVSGLVSSLTLERAHPRAPMEHTRSALFSILITFAVVVGRTDAERMGYVLVASVFLILGGMFSIFGSWLCRLAMTLRWRRIMS